MVRPLNHSPAPCDRRRKFPASDTDVGKAALPVLGANSFNPEPTATVIAVSAVAVGSGLNDANGMFAPKTGRAGKANAILTRISRGCKPVANMARHGHLSHIASHAPGIPCPGLAALLQGVPFDATLFPPDIAALAVNRATAHRVFPK
jgi:hypothetical protein